MEIKNIIKVLLSLSIIGYIIYIVDINILYQNITKLNSLDLLAVFGLVIINCIIGSYNLYILTKNSKEGLTPKDLFGPYFYSWSFGQVLPSKIGELTRIYFIKEIGIKLKDSTIIFLIDKVNSIIYLSIVTILGLQIIAKIGIKVNILILILAIISILVILFSRKIRIAITKILPQKLKEMVILFLDSFTEYTKKNKKEVAINFTINIFRMILDGLIIVILFESLNFSVNLWPILVVNAVTTLSSIIPITISGLGIRELLAVFILNNNGIPKETTFIVYLIMAGIRLIISIIIISIYTSKNGLNIIKNNIK